jgi:transposase
MIFKKIWLLKLKGFELSAEDLSELKAIHREALKRKAKEAYKLNAIILLGSGWSIQDVSEALLLSDETLRSYVKKYRKGHFNALLKILNRGRPPKLNNEETVELKEELTRKIYTSTKEICHYVKIKFNKKFSASGITALLHRLDFVYKKPKYVPGNPDKELQEFFLSEYKRFLSRKNQDEQLFFMDAVHPVHNSIATEGWLPKGIVKSLQTNSARQRLNIHGAMNAETFETHVLMSEENVNHQSTIDLLLNLEKFYPHLSKLYVILDNAKYHYSLAVKEALKDSKIKLVFLPAYSPELNLIERLWFVFKKNILYNKYYEKFKDFKDACFGFFKNYGQYQNEITSIMGEGLDALVIE